MPQTTSKRCPRCGGRLPLDSFGKHGGRPDGRASYCRPCANAMSREWKANNPEKARAIVSKSARRAYALAPDVVLEKNRIDRLKRVFGLTEEEYDAMLLAQGGVCALCHKSCTSGRRLCVDHDHQTGKVRGLLCGNCNRAVGLFDDDPELLYMASAYLAPSLMDAIA